MRSNFTDSSAMALISISSVSMISASRIDLAWHMSAPPETCAITPFLWFDHQPEEAAWFYTSISKNSRVASSLAMAKQDLAPKIA